MVRAPLAYPVSVGLKASEMEQLTPAASVVGASGQPVLTTLKGAGAAMLLMVMAAAWELVKVTTELAEVALTAVAGKVMLAGLAVWAPAVAEPRRPRIAVSERVAVRQRREMW